MGKKTSLLPKKIRKIIKPFFRWWNLENWNSSADLFLKLMSIIALVLAADFFLLKPNVVWDVKYLDQLERNKIEEYYRKAGKEVPKGITDAIDNFFYSLDYNKQTGVIDMYDYGRGDPEVPDGQFVFYLFDFIKDDNFTDEEKWFAWDAIREATTTIGKITISNIGSASASRIQIIPPPPFVLDETSTQFFDLAPNKSVMLLINAGEKYNFSGEYFWGDNSGKPPNVVVVWDTSKGAINKTLFLRLSILAIVIWLTVIGKEIWFSKK